MGPLSPLFGGKEEKAKQATQPEKPDTGDDDRDGGASVKVNPKSLEFGEQEVSTTSVPPRTVTLTNEGSALLNISNIVASGGFDQKNDCASVRPRTSCSINVTFTPAAEGDRSGTLVITDNVPGSPQKVSLSGKGTAPGEGPDKVPYYQDTDGDGYGAGNPVGYEPGTEPEGWVQQGRDNCPNTFNLRHQRVDYLLLAYWSR